MIVPVYVQDYNVVVYKFVMVCVDPNCQCTSVYIWCHWIRVYPQIINVLVYIYDDVIDSMNSPCTQWSIIINMTDYVPVYIYIHHVIMNSEPICTFCMILSKLDVIEETRLNS